MERAAKEVDVVTTGTFGAMCSSGAFLNFGHSEPPIRMQKVTLNDVPAYGGLAAVDAYIGATELKLDDHKEYGGAHVIEELVSGKPVRLKATSDGTDCYPRKDIDTYVSLNTVNQAYLFNPRNAYQNYAAGTNSSERTLVHLHGQAASQLRQHHLLQCRTALAVAERSDLTHHRNWYEDIPGRWRRLRRVGRYAVPDQRGNEVRSAHGRRPQSRYHRRHEGHVPRVRSGAEPAWVRRLLGAGRRRADSDTGRRMFSKPRR
ncbi:MAG: homocysteine biosynthesis protein [Sphingobacterium sp.]|nr:homocysteine biosynthesis protein [Sphingobacterium sp.]